MGDKTIKGTRKTSGVASKVLFLDVGGGHKGTYIQYPPIYTFVLCDVLYLFKNKIEQNKQPPSITYYIELV